VRDFYDKISLGGHGYQISQTTDAFTERVLLFSGIEVKLDDGGKKEALAQLAIWLMTIDIEREELRSKLNTCARMSVLISSWWLLLLLAGYCHVT
jgi:hypothetical protein